MSFKIESFGGSAAELGPEAWSSFFLYKYNQK